MELTVNSLRNAMQKFDRMLGEATPVHKNVMVGYYSQVLKLRKMLGLHQYSTEGLIIKEMKKRLNEVCDLPKHPVYNP